jgi:cation diffusion facilitator CzcD-associated flavoprotein CzcO
MLSAIIVGAGFSGVAASILLRKAGIDDFVVLEKARGVGGTWRENTYPGAACDVQSHLYSYSFAPNPQWSRSYSPQHEILAYLEACVDRFGVRPHLRFGAEVVDARFDERAGAWTVRTRDGDAYTARALVLGNGALHLPSFPPIEGRERFTGRSFHSAQWDHDYDLDGKRVAVIGTGASAIQFVPEIAPRVAQLHLFQRTPPWVLPKPDRDMRARERWLFEHVPGAHWLRRTGLYWQMESRVWPLNHAPRLHALAEKAARRFIASQVADPVLRRKVTPSYQLGCKRVLLSNDYYPALNRANVDVVTDGIASIEASGIRTKAGVLVEVDAILYGTGFRVADYLSPIHIEGRGGVLLNDAWSRSPRNYLGINVSGFPNLFLLMGPNTGLGHNSMIFMIEAQARYAVQAIELLREKKLAFLDVRASAEAAFRAEIAEKMKDTVWTSGCSAWYQTPDGEVILWPGFTFDYWWRTRRVRIDHYETRAS